MAHVIQPASSSRAKCRGCGERIAKGELRLGERLPNPFAEGEMTHWFHVPCAAYKRPESFLEAIAATAELIEDTEELKSEAERGIAHRRLVRVDGAGRAPTGRAHCRSCHEPIDKGAWRIALVFYEEGRFQPSGFIHPRCSSAYFETPDVIERVQHFSPELSDENLNELRAELSAGGD